VDQHGRVEVILGEHLSDVCQMFSDFIPARGIARVVRLDFGSRRHPEHSAEENDAADRRKISTRDLRFARFKGEKAVIR